MKASSVKAYLELARWQNCLIAAAGVFVGAWWAGWANPVRIGFAVGTAIALTIFANAFNDVLDDLSLVDRKAHPQRPLPSGRIAFRPAMYFAITAAALGTAMAFGAGFYLGLLTMSVVPLMALYTVSLKRAGLLGNVTVAVLASLPFLYGAWAAGNPLAGIVLVSIAAPLHFAREIAKDIDDMPGDLGHRRTVPIRWGLRVANALILVALLAFAVQIVPVARAWPRLAFGIIPALAFAVYAAGRALKGAPGAPRAFKAAMLCAMAAFVIARA